MATQLLVNVLSVGPVPALGGVVLAHGLRSGDQPVTPTQVLCDRASPLIVSAMNDLTVSIINPTGAPLSANFRCEFDHSIHAVGATPTKWQGAAFTLPPSGPAGGDLDQTYPDPRVVGFASKPIDTTAPAANDYWQFDGTTWRHVAVSPGTPTAIYGSYANTDGPSVIPVSPLAPVAITFDTIEGQHGVTLDGYAPGPPVVPSSKIKVGQAGVYEFSFSPQLKHTGGNASTISMWLRLNGLSPVPRSNSDVKLANNNDTIFLAISIILTLAAGDYVEWLMSSDGGTQTDFISFAGSGGVGPNDRPLAPAIIAGVKFLGV